VNQWNLANHVAEVSHKNLGNQIKEVSHKKEENQEVKCESIDASKPYQVNVPQVRSNPGQKSEPFKLSNPNMYS